MTYRSEMQARATAILAREDLVVLDTETTGLDRAAGVVQIGIVDSGGETLLDTLVNPGCLISPAATRVHGITDKMVVDAPDIWELGRRLDALMRNRCIVGYNTSFDVRILRQSFARAGRGLPAFLATITTVDVMPLFAEYYGEWNDYHGNYRWQKLAAAAQYFGLDTGNAHGAAADARLTLGVLRGMAGQVVDSR